jgi:hypothetical protein
VEAGHGSGATCNVGKIGAMQPVTVGAAMLRFAEGPWPIGQCRQ